MFNTSQTSTNSAHHSTQRLPFVDAHHHLWRYRSEEFGWLDEPMRALRRDFLVHDLRSAMRVAQIDSCIAVQARRTLDETQWLLDSADAFDPICGVVGWVPLLAADLASSLDRFSGCGKLLGLREIVQAEPNGYLDQPAFDRGIVELTARDLTYDLLIRDHQIEEATRFVDRHPNQRFVLDHAAKPRIAAAELEPWRSQIRALARRNNVFCKLSGLSTEAHWSSWTLDDLRPYLDVCVEAFGPTRLMAGSDWPVSLVATTYTDWWTTLATYLADFSATEQQSIRGGTAIAFYKPALVTRLNNEATS